MLTVASSCAHSLSPAHMIRIDSGAGVSVEREGSGRRERRRTGKRYRRCDGLYPNLSNTDTNPPPYPSTKGELAFVFDDNLNIHLAMRAEQLIFKVSIGRETLSFETGTRTKNFAVHLLTNVPCELEFFAVHFDFRSFSLQ